MCPQAAFLAAMRKNAFVHRCKHPTEPGNHHKAPTPLRMSFEVARQDLASLMARYFKVRSSLPLKSMKV